MAEGFTSGPPSADFKPSPVTPAERPSPPEPIMQFFAYAHLPSHLQDVSRPFCELAERIYTQFPRNAERTVALRKLLESKDAAVRAALAK